MPDVIRGWGAEEEAEVSNGGSRGGFGFGMRGTLDAAEKEIPIPPGTEIIVPSSGAMGATLGDVFVPGAVLKPAFHFKCLTLTSNGYSFPASDNSRQGESQCSKEPSQHC
jgi:hypothetical protein